MQREIRFSYSYPRRTLLFPSVGHRTLSEREELLGLLVSIIRQPSSRSSEGPSIRRIISLSGLALLLSIVERSCAIHTDATCSTQPLPAALSESVFLISNLARGWIVMLPDYEGQVSQGVSVPLRRIGQLSNALVLASASSTARCICSRGNRRKS